MAGRYFLQLLAGALHEVDRLQGLHTYLLGVIGPLLWNQYKDCYPAWYRHTLYYTPPCNVVDTN